MTINIDPTKYQKTTASQLKKLLGLPVETEWRSMREQKSLYCPRVDIAVGPFVYNEKCIPDVHDKLVGKFQKQLQTMLEYHRRNVEKLSFEVCDTTIEESCYKNKSARCLMAIEIENRTGRKHLIGATINALALGRLGIVVAFTPDKLRAFVKLRRYLWFLSRATNLDTKNLLILDKEQFADSFGLNIKA
jgi:hypothetical protein